jgi:hypothetical protein
MDVSLIRSADPVLTVHFFTRNWPRLDGSARAADARQFVHLLPLLELLA